MTGSDAVAKFRLDGRIAFVSGAAGHLGRAMVHVLAGAGAHVVANGRDGSRLARLVDEMQSAGLSAEAAPFDMTDTAAVRAFFSARKRLDVLVNNAVTMTPKPPAEIEAADFDLAYRSSVVAAFEAVRAALPALVAAAAAAGEASVVNIASIYATVGPDPAIYSEPGQASPAHYGPAKAGLVQLTRHLAAELGPRRIRVNAITPGPFPRQAVRDGDPAFAARLAARTMLGRLGEAGEIAGPLLFLASPASSFVTGSVLPVDGGWTAW